MMDILIIDDHPIFSAGLKELLLIENQDLTIDICKDGTSAVELITRNMPGLVLLDLDLGRENGLVLTEQLSLMFPELRIAILSGSDSISDMKESIERGAVGYITKSSDPDTLLKAVDLLRSTGCYFPSYLLPYLAKTGGSHESTKNTLSAQLTRRELDVFSHLRHGKSNKAIALELGISEGTVKLHVSSILEKLKVKNRSEAIVKMSNRR